MAPVPWADLPVDILIDIFEPLEIPDLLRASSVCSSFRSAVSKSPKLNRRAPPWLMLDTGNEDDEFVAKYYSLSEKKIYKIPMEEPFCSWCVLGSSHGWLVFADDRSDLHLLNPLTRRHIPLPPVATMDGINPILDDEGFITRYETSFFGDIQTEALPSQFTSVVLSSDPSEGDYYVAMIHSPRLQSGFLSWGRISFVKGGDERWTLLDDEMFYNDMVFREGLLYGVTETGGIHVWDLAKKPSPSLEVVVQEEDYCGDDGDDYSEEALLKMVLTDKYMMVAPCGEILVVFSADISERDCAKVSVYNVDASQKKLVEINSLGDHALFLAGNNSGWFCTKTCSNLRANNIHFLDCCYDLQSKHLGNQSFEIDLPQNYNPSAWITPNVFTTNH